MARKRYNYYSLAVALLLILRGSLGLFRGYDDVLIVVLIILSLLGTYSGNRRREIENEDNE